MKKTLVLFMIIMLVMGLCACGSSEKDEQIKELKKQIRDLEDQIAELEETNGKVDSDKGHNDKTENDTDDKDTENKIEDSNNKDEVIDEETDKESENKTVALKFGETVSTPFVEITIDSIGTADEIKPENPDSVYRYLSDQEGETYIYAKGTIKNIGTEQFEYANNSYVQLIVDEKYKYAGSVNGDEGGNLSFIYAYLDPFGSVTFYLSASVPDELVNQYSKATFVYGFADNFSENDPKEEVCTYMYSVTGVK